MRNFFVAVVLVLGAGSQAEAQWMIRLQPPVVVQPTELWMPVNFRGHLTYELNGIRYWVAEGNHWRLGELECSLTANKFVEPFDVFGCRIFKRLPPLPAGTQYTIQSGWMIHAVVNGKSHFSTWVDSGNGRLCPVWVAIEEEPQMLSKPTVEPNPVQLGPGIEPYEEESLVIPQRSTPLIPERPPIPFPAPEFK